MDDPNDEDTLGKRKQAFYSLKFHLFKPEKALFKWFCANTYTYVDTGRYKWVFIT